MRIVVTAGPTREFFDDVRFLSNPSTGRTGFAIAEEAAKRGHRVTLIYGPVGLPLPASVIAVPVETASQMARAVRRAFARADVLVMTAAVCDYRPAERVRGKIKKSRRPIRVTLLPTEDILEGLGRRKGGRILVGFAVESSNELAAPRRKLEKKNLDLVVGNSPRTFGSDRIRAVLLYRDGRCESLAEMDKRKFARELLDRIEDLAP